MRGKRGEWLVVRIFGFLFLRGVRVGVWWRFMPKQIVGIEGPNRGGAVAAAMGEVGDGFGLRAGFR